MARKGETPDYNDIDPESLADILRLRHEQAQARRHTRESYYNALLRQGYTPAQAYALVVEHYGEEE